MSWTRCSLIIAICWAWPLTPLSRGHIHIHTSDPFASPRITPRFLSDDFDVETGPIISEVVIDAVPANATDNDWAKWYRDTSFGASHSPLPCSSPVARSPAPHPAFCGGFLAAADPIALEVAVAAHGLVISLVAYTHHTAVMQAAIEGKTHIAIDGVHAKGGKVKEFHLQCGALPTPPTARTAPSGTSFSWYPHGGLLALLNSRVLPRERRRQARCWCGPHGEHATVRHQELTSRTLSLHIAAHKNQMCIFPYLIPLHILYGHHPSDEFMHRFPILTDIFAPFIAAIHRTGDIAGFDRARGLHVSHGRRKGGAYSMQWHYVDRCT
ncbi:hypothetical protein B0H14DRAFT_3885948 [Mycena olivaceomarginata]|nr:hypothetical protein B0H14DRAFT_3885948 [Mycena olivaceomarginata]